ncbi:porin family protein [Haloflavibacter putidus]|uniref:PorT family protein n=1 Tax=Haloflavibacter putidus TaxID=2576776 RepID=A0A507ZRY5_9FLAO|nr:porin family protein [Haloflavibacter putidus]TQD39044.1 PorT family protein [Haloflavibacter putidus]
MKKIVSLSLLFLLPITMLSQNRFGVFAGANNSTLSDGFLEKIGVENALGFHLGGLYELELSEKITLRPKLMLSLQGDREETSGNYIDASSIDYKLTYINIPLNVKFFSKPYIIAGPQIGILASTKKAERDFGEVKSNLDYGVNLGVGYDFKNIFIELNMYQGLETLIHIESSLGQSVEVDATNTVLQLSLGYYFN